MQIIKNNEELAQFCEHAKKSEFITLDTEFLREATYWPKLCLIQAATIERAVIIDPMAKGLKLRDFFALLQNENIIKIFHAARQDIEIFVNLTKKVPFPCFDTQIAASVCGFGDSVSYDNLVRQIIGVQIDKSSRFTDWSHRPLSEKQLQYALADVTYLREIYQFLQKKIKKLGRQDWVENENASLASIETYIIKPENAYKRMKLKVNKPRDYATLKLLAAWREKKAQQKNIPRQRVLKDEALTELAIQRPLKIENFDRLRIVPKGFGGSKYAKELIKIFMQANKLKEEELPKIPKRNNANSTKGAIGDLIRVLLKFVAEKEGVAARLIASSSDIDRLILDDNADIPALKGWRYEIFGKKALAIKHGKLALSANENGLLQIEINSTQ